MSENPATADNKLRFEKLANGFPMKLPRKLALMLPFQAHIAELLAKQASYDDIRILLADVNVIVSTDTVHRFCRRMIGQRPSRHRDQPDNPAVPPSKILPPQPTLKAALQEHREQIPGPWSRRKPGPRIANSKNL